MTQISAAHCHYLQPQQAASFGRIAIQGQKQRAVGFYPGDTKTKRISRAVMVATATYFYDHATTTFPQT